MRELLTFYRILLLGSKKNAAERREIFSNSSNAHATRASGNPVLHRGALRVENYSRETWV